MRSENKEREYYLVSRDAALCRRKFDEAAEQLYDFEMPTRVLKPDLPYAHLNLRRNPFGELSLNEWAELAIVDIENVLPKLQKRRFVLQFMGEKGYGKTTHLLAIRSRCPNAAYTHIPEGQRARILRGTPILVDEAQRLTFWQRLSTFRSPIPLVLGTHRDFTDELIRAGRKVETIHVDAATTADRLHKIVNARVEEFRRGAGAVPSVSPETAATLLLKFGPDIRGAMHELYTTFQTLRDIRTV